MTMGSVFRALASEAGGRDSLVFHFLRRAVFDEFLFLISPKILPLSHVHHDEVIHAYTSMADHGFKVNLFLVPDWIMNSRQHEKEPVKVRSSVLIASVFYCSILQLHI